MVARICTKCPHKTTGSRNGKKIGWCSKYNVPTKMAMNRDATSWKQC